MNNINILGVLPTINASACLLRNGEIIAMAEEERFSRIKTAGDVFPLRAIKYVLEEGKISLSDINYIAIAWDSMKYPKFMRKFASENFHNRTKLDYIIEQIHTARFAPDFVKFKLETGLKMMGIRDRIPEIRFIPHHLSHAASTFYMSGFDKAVIVTADGSGEENATVLWKGEGVEITKIKEINLPNSLGWFYGAITEFLGFKANVDEGKVMGLAPYGRENLEIRKKMSRIITIDEDGYTVDPAYIYFDKRSWSTKFTDRLVELLGEPLKPKEPITQYYKDIAFEAQYALELAVEKLVLFGINKTGIRKVCMVMSKVS